MFKDKTEIIRRIGRNTREQMDGHMFEAKQILNKAKDSIQVTISFDNEEKNNHRYQRRERNKIMKFVTNEEEI